MRIGMRAGMGWAAGAVLLVAGAMRAQQDQGSPAPQKSCAVVDENGKTVIWPDCKPPAEETKPAASGTVAVPASSANSQAPATKRFPFPGEPGPAPAAAGGDAKTVDSNGSGGMQDAGSSGSSSSSSSSSGDAGGDASAEGGGVGPLADDDTAAREAAARKAARHKLPPVARQSPDERETEDLKVASFYMDDKNFKGAYLRAVDAVSVADDDAEAHLALAEAARKLGKLDEAKTHYKRALTLDPVPKTKKTAEKALKEMAGG